MPLKYFIFIFVFFCSSLSSASDFEKLRVEDYEYLGFSHIQFPDLIQIDKGVEVSLGKYVDETYGENWSYEIYSIYDFKDSKGLYIKFRLFVLDKYMATYVKQQRERLSKGLSKKASSIDAVIFFDGNRFTEIGVDLDEYNQGLRFQFSGCPSDKTLMFIDFNGDGTEELLVLKGYQSGTDAYWATYDHYKIHMISDYQIFDSWIYNSDFEITEINSSSLPMISGMNQGNKGLASISYGEIAEAADLVKYGFIRKNSIFLFREPILDEAKSYQQIIISWEEVYRPERSGDNQVIFSKKKDYFSFFIGSIGNKEPFVKVDLSEEKIQYFLKSHNLTFDDGINKRAICGYQ